LQRMRQTAPYHTMGERDSLTHSLPAVVQVSPFVRY
jgi:hypothetical protein